MWGGWGWEWGWGWGWGGWQWSGGAAGALAAAALLLLLARCRRRALRRAKRDRLHTVHIVRDAFPSRTRPPRAASLPLPLPLAAPLPVSLVAPLPAPLLAPLAPRRALSALTGAPADDRAPQPPQIVIVKNSTQNTIVQGPSQSSSSSQDPSTSTEFKGIPKLPLPEQWLHKRPLDCKYTSIIPRPLAQIVNSELGTDLSQESRAKKYSATRSPSLEKDDKSPFLTSAKSDKVFGFDTEVVRKLSDQSNSEKVEDMSEKAAMMSPKEREERDASPSNLRRFRSVSTRLNMCSVNESHLLEGHQERLETQNSPRVLECSSAKEKSTASKFDFSPKILTDTIASPRFFTPPETVSPMFFTEPSPKSVYYDTVRSPKFFPETPRDAEVPQSPKALGDHINRSNGIEKPNSPRVLSARPSPKVHSYNKENYFNFEQSCVVEEGAVGVRSPRPRKYGGRNSIERERFTPPADKDVRKYRRHNSCDTNYKTVELNISNWEDNKKIEAEIDNDVVDCCAKIDSMDMDTKTVEKTNELTPSPSSTAHARRQRLKSISLDSDNAKIIEQNLGLPIAKQMKDQMNEAYKNQDASASCESMERHQKTPTNDRPIFKFEDEQKEKNCEEEDEPKSPDLIQKKSLRQSSDVQSFIDMPRFSPKEFEITITSDEGATTSADTQMKRKGKNLRNLTIDLTKRDSDLEKELQEFEKLYTTAEEKKVKTPTLKVKATSLDSSDSVNLSLPQNKTLEVPQNSVSVPNTPKRQLKRILPQKNVKNDHAGNKAYNPAQANAEQRRLFMKGQDSGIYLRENHASLMLYQPGTSRMGTMGSFDENVADQSETTPEINVSGADNRQSSDTCQSLGSNLVNYKPNLSVSSTNLKTLPEGVPSDDFEPSAEDEKVVKKLHRRNSNQSLMLSTQSLQESNSSGASCHNLSTVRTSVSNFSLNSDNRQNKLSLEGQESNADNLTPTTLVVCSSNTNLSGGEGSKNCLLQRRSSNNSLSLNIDSKNNLSRYSSNSSLNKDAKPVQKKGLLERRSSNTSLTLNINSSNPQLSGNKGLSVSNYNLNGSTCTLSQYNSNISIDNSGEYKKGVNETRGSNASLTLNEQAEEPRDLDIDEALIDCDLKDLPHRDMHRKSLSTENLGPKSYRNRTRSRSSEKCGFGSHDNFYSDSYAEQDYPRNLMYVGGDQDNEIIYACGSEERPNDQSGFTRHISTRPISPQKRTDEFKSYMDNMRHLNNASSVLSREQLKYLSKIFLNGYSKFKCNMSTVGNHFCSGLVGNQPCSEYQKTLLRNLHHEFWDLPLNFQEKQSVDGASLKNRYKGLLANDHSRFKLYSDDDEKQEIYINANFMKGHENTTNCYIATQGPMENTMYDFWMMVYKNRCQFHEARSPDHSPANTIQKIVMLTALVEGHKQKCDIYYPLELNEEMVVKPEKIPDRWFEIKNCGMINKFSYTIRKLEVKYCLEPDSIIVYHYWFHDWPDQTCTTDLNGLINLCLDVLKVCEYDFDKYSEVNQDITIKCSDIPKQDSKFLFPPLDDENSPCDVKIEVSSPLDESVKCPSPPIVIHCSAGLGRTGCLIAILNGIKQLTYELKVDVLDIVSNMRMTRGGMIQNSEQYELIHKVLCLYEQACLPEI